MIISPSLLAIAGAGLAPDGTEVCDERHLGQRCAVCGATLQPGDPVDNLNLPPSFTNHTSLAIPGGAWRCGACTTIMTRGVFQMGASTVLISAGGIFPIVRKEHRAWAFLTPPEPPFAIAIQNAKQQHVIWRAPVTLSKDLIFVRVGEQLMRIRHPLLMSARGEALALDVLNRSRGRPVKGAAENPFVNDWRLQSATGGRFKGWLWNLLKEASVSREDIKALTQLNGAEAWALTAALHDHPEQPESISPSIE
jgi:CRISPR type IV-associated protein Csf1